MLSYHSTRRRRVLVAACSIAATSLLFSTPGHAATGTWNADASANWSDATRWASSTVADGAGFNANFTFNITAARTITLDSARTIGGMTFTDSTTASHDWTLSGANILTLDGTAPLSLNVTNRAATISLVMTTADGDLVQKTGGGTLVLNAQNTIAGGFNQTAGITRVSVNSTVTGGVVASGPVGTSLLTLTGGTFQDNNAARTLQNELALAGSVTLSSSGTTGSLTFNSAGLTTPTTIGITVANPTLTVTNTTNFNNAISSANAFTKAGAGRLNLGADNSGTWSASAVTVTGGVLGFTSTLAAPTGAARPIIANTGGAATLAGAALTQAFVDKVALASTGVIAIDAATAGDIDFTGFTGGLRLGSTGAFAYTGNHTPADPNVYRLGGGGGTLTYGSAISGAGVSVNIGNNGTATGAVVLGNAANSFAGGITIDNGVLSLDTADAAPGNPSKLGMVPLTPTNNLTLLNGGLIRFAAGATLDANRSIVLGAGGGGIDTNGQNVTLNNAISGVNPFIKTGTGTLTLPAGGAFMTTTVSGGTLVTAAGQSLTTGTLTIGQNGTNGTVTVGAGGAFAIGTGASTDLNIGTRNDAVDRATTGALDLSAATGTNSINVNNLRIEADYGGSSSNGIMTGSLLLPTNAAAVTNIAGLTAVILGNSPTEGGNATVQFNIGGGTVNVTTPTMTVGGQKVSANVTSAAGATFKLSNGAGRTTLNVGANTGTNTGTNPVVTMNLSNATADLLLGQVIIANRTGGGAGDSTGTLTLSGNAGNIFDASSATQTLLIGRVDGGAAGVLAEGTMNFGGGTATITGTSASNTPVVLGRHTGTFTGTSAGTASGTINITGGSMTVNAASGNAIVLAVSDTTVTSTGAAINGTLTVNGGSLTVNKGIAHGGGATGPTYTSTLNLQAGLLDMAGNALTNLTAINFTGGTLRNAGTITRAAGLTQNGASSIVEVLANNTTLTGPYTVTAGTTTISTQRLLTVGGAMDLSGAADTLLISDPTSQLTGAPITLATFASLTGGFHYDTVKYFDGTNTFTFTDAQATTPGSLPNNYVLQYGATDLQLVQVPEPGALGLAALAGLGLLSRRRRRW